MSTRKHQVIAQRIVNCLFTNGFGEQAQRLVLTDDGPRDLGGLSREAVVTIVLEILKQESR